jgi:hypothetical protein
MMSNPTFDEIWTYRRDAKDAGLEYFSPFPLTCRR